MLSEKTKEIVRYIGEDGSLHETEVGRRVESLPRVVIAVRGIGSAKRPVRDVIGNKGRHDCVR